MQRRRASEAAPVHDPPMGLRGFRALPDAAARYHAAMRRQMVMILVFLLIGAAVNIAVAWALALRPMADSERWLIGADDDATFVKYIDFANNALHHTVVCRTGELKYQQYPYTPGISAIPLADRSEFESLLPSWCAYYNGVKLDSPAEFEAFTEFATGWPLLSLRYEEHYYSGHGIITVNLNAISTTRAQGSLSMPTWMIRGEMRTAVPYWPVWPGFLGNTGMYSFACFALYVLAFALPPAVRRHDRRRRGRCIRCAYDLRGGEPARCPECGFVVPVTTCRTEPAAADE